MDARETALRYITRGWPLFPRPSGRFVGHGWKDATLDPDRLAAWCRQYRHILWATPTGHESGLIVLDIDCKGGRNGFDTLADLGKTALPETPMVHTKSGGLHLHFAENPNVQIRFTQGELGPGLDVLGELASVALPSPGWNYHWDQILHPGTTAHMTAPQWLARRRPR